MEAVGQREGRVDAALRDDVMVIVTSCGTCPVTSCSASSVGSTS